MGTSCIPQKSQYETNISNQLAVVEDGYIKSLKIYTHLHYSDKVTSYELWAQVQNKTKEVIMSNKFCIEIQNHMYNLYN